MWAIAPYKSEFDARFRAAGPDARGRLAPARVREALLPTGLDARVLRGVWELADIDGDGALDADEFAVALYLCRQSQAGAPLPKKLPADWVPPSKRTANPF